MIELGPRLSIRPLAPTLCEGAEQDRPETRQMGCPPAMSVPPDQTPFGVLKGSQDIVAFEIRWSSLISSMLMPDAKSSKRFSTG